MNGSVIIIGSGLSGFSAAGKLMENGFEDITILEAENRIGGRVNSVPFSDGIIDLGAQWVHGQKNNLIYEMTKKYFEFGSTPFEELHPTFLLSNGTMPKQEILQKIYDLGFKIIDDIDDMDDPEGSIGELFLEKFEKALKSSKSGLKNIDPKIIELMKEDIRVNVNGYWASKSWFDLSAKLGNAEDYAEGDHHNTWKKQGFQTVFNFISKKAPNPSDHLDIESKVQLNKKVTNIKYNTDDPSFKVEVNCVDGTTYSAQHVIFTASLGVLKKYHHTLFTPQLPERKVKAIGKYGFGSVGKVFLEFNEPFWLESGKPFLSFEFLWLDDAKNEAKETNREWMFGITGVYAVDLFPNLLEFFIGGEDLDQFENSSDEKIIDDCMWALEKFLGKNLPKPIAMKRTNWLTNENFLGAYSYPSIDAEKANVGIKDIASTIKNVDDTPVLLFGGEAADLKFPSMAHGAVNSGYRVAKEIIKHYKK